jgi:hypothetical protein
MRRARGTTARAGLLACAGVLASGLVTGAAASPVDRTVVRFDAPETGGVTRPQFIFERELAFEARLEALADPDRTERSTPYLDRHLRSALERHIAEELLAHLVMDPEPSAAELTRRASGARSVLEQRVGGPDKLTAAADAEGIEEADVDRLVAREARASLYLDRMVAPMLEPSEAELREVHHGANPFRGRPFEEILPALRRWYVAERLEGALGTFFQNARGRVHVTFTK